MACPLCAHERSCPSWLGSTYYRGCKFRYVECLGCHSLYCDPMPDANTLAQMYGVEYARNFNAGAEVDDPREPERVVQWLRDLGGGTFIDYGCGSGCLLAQAKQLSWIVIGVEFDHAVARETAKATGVHVVSLGELDSLQGFPADVLHLGDVLEHLTRLNEQMPSVLRLLRPGGLLLAQGPLEANPNLFTWVLRLARTVRQRRVEMAPYHVILATAQGQRALFRRFGLEEVEFSMREVDWPAPSHLSWSDLKNVRLLALFVLRRISKSLTSIRRHRWGNRYFYAGRRCEATASVTAAGRSA